MRLSHLRLHDSSGSSNASRGSRSVTEQSFKPPHKGAASTAPPVLHPSNVAPLRSFGPQEEYAASFDASSSGSTTFPVATHAEALSEGRRVAPALHRTAALAPSYSVVSDAMKDRLDGTTREGGGSVQLVSKQRTTWAGAGAAAAANRSSGNYDDLSASSAYDKRVKSPSTVRSSKAGTVDSPLEIPTPEPSHVEVPKRQPPVRGSVRRTMTPDGRQAWVLFSPRRGIRYCSDSVPKAAVTGWNRKVVGSPPDHLPRRVLDVVAGGIGGARGVGKSNKAPSGRDQPSAVGGGHNLNRNPEPKPPQRFAVPHFAEAKERRVLLRAEKEGYQNDHMHNDEYSDRSWATLRRWLLRKYRKTNGKLLCSKSEIAATLQEWRRGLGAAAESLLLLLQPVRVESGGGSRWFPLPRGWMPSSGAVIPFSAQTMMEPSGHFATAPVRRSSQCTTGHTAGLDDDTIVPKGFPNASYSTSLKRAVLGSGQDPESPPLRVGIDVSEDDYAKAFFSLDPLPIHDADDVAVYASLLHKGGTLAAAPGTTSPQWLSTGAKLTEKGDEGEADEEDEEKEEENAAEDAAARRRGSTRSRATTTRQHCRETAGRYGLWCILEPLTEEVSVAATATREPSSFLANTRGMGRRRDDVQVPRWCLQICGGALPRRYCVSSSSSVESSVISYPDDVETGASNTVVAARFEALFFPQPPDYPSNMFGPRLTVSAAVSATPPICSIPLTPQLLRASEVPHYRAILMQQGERVRLRHEQEEGFVLGQGENREELFLLLTQVTVNATQKYCLDLSVYLMPCRLLRTDSNAFKPSPVAALVEVPLLHSSPVITATRRVHGAKLIFTTKNAFVKAYRAILWASVVNTTAMRPMADIPAYLCDKSGESPYMALQCFAPLSQKTERCAFDAYREQCVQHVASVLLKERDFFGVDAYRLEDFALGTASNRGKRKPLSSAATLPLTTCAFSSAVAYDVYGVVYRAVHTPSARVFDVRVLPRNSTKLLWAGATAVGGDCGSAGDSVSLPVMEAALVAEYLSRMPFQNPIAAVLCDAHKLYVVSAPIFSVLSEAKRHTPPPATSIPHPCHGFGVVSLQCFMEKVLRSPHTLFSTRWELARLVAAQLLLTLISLHGKGVVLGPCAPRRFFLQCNPDAVSRGAVGADDKKEEGLTTGDFHLVVAAFGVTSDAWVYERQQPGVVEYIPPRYLFRVAHSTVLGASGASEWTVGDDYWSYLCLVFELFSATGEPLVAAPSRPKEEGEHRDPNATSPQRQREIMQLWKAVFSLPPASATSGEANLHREPAVTQALHDFVQSRVAAAILHKVEAWVTMEEHHPRSDGSNVRQPREAERSRTRATPGAVSLADAYWVALRSHPSSLLSTGGEVAGAAATADFAVADAAHFAESIKSTQASMLTIQHFCQILVGMALQSTAACIDKAAHRLTWTLLSHPFFIGIDFAKLFDGNLPVPHAKFVCGKLLGKTLLGAATCAASGKSNRHGSGSPTRGGLQQPRLPSYSGLQAAHRLCVPLALLPMAADDGEGGGARGKDDAFTPSSSRSAGGSIHGIYKASEIEEMEQVQEEVRRALRTFASTDTASPSLLVAREQKQPKRDGCPRDSLTVAPLTAVGKMALKEEDDEGEKNPATSTWKRLQQRATLSARSAATNSDIRPEERPSKSLFPAAWDPTGGRVSPFSLPSHSSISRALASADPLRQTGVDRRHCPLGERFLHVANDDHDRDHDERRSGLRGQGELLQVAAAVTVPSGIQEDRPGHQQQQWRQEQGHDGGGASPASSATHGTRRPASARDGVRGKKMAADAGDDFLIRVQGASLTTVLPHTAEPAPAPCRKSASDAFMLVPSDDDDDDEDGEDEACKRKKHEGEVKARTVGVSVPRAERNSLLPRSFGVVRRRQSSRASYSTSTFKSSTWMASVPSFDALDPHQHQVGADEAIWELVHDDGEDDEGDDKHVTFYHM
ncbi:transferase [Trypanosoma conorhini]|uniref:Transferase n=1 Tax=Trypanosoma conorhini TaxID=83891 RepID=A0A422PUL9_9TRYP|nr:transferase [Trypanosoma conorhini]RNF21413.1 transferase [Trypanosoma conorhini]